MRTLLALLAATLLGVGACACGSASKEADSASRSSSGATAANTTAATTTSGAAPVYTKADSDKDNDIGAPYDDTNNNSVLMLGHAASAADERAVAALIRRYYSAASAGEGAKACSTIISSLAKAVGEDYGHGSAGPSYLSAGTTCPAVMDLLFKHFHSQLAVEIPKLKLTRVRIDGQHGAAVLSFGTMPEREFAIIREGHAWKLDDLLDTELP